MRTKAVTINMEKLLLTVEEAAEMLSTSRTHVFDLIRRDELGSLKLDGRRRIPTSSVHEYVSQKVLEYQAESA